MSRQLVLHCPSPGGTGGDLLCDTQKKVKVLPVPACKLCGVPALNVPAPLGGDFGGPHIKSLLLRLDATYAGQQRVWSMALKRNGCACAQGH